MSDSAVEAGTQQREVVSIDLAAPPEAVWSALRDPAELRRWFGWDYHGLDDEIAHVFIDRAVEDTASDTRTLSWPDGDVVILTAADGGTHLTITRRGPAPGSELGPDPTDEGWLQFAQQLRFLVERKPAGRRRTVAAIDLDGGPVGAGPVYRLGVAASDGVPVGGHWEVSRDLGAEDDAVGGTIWYRSHFQAGYTVADHAGEALLVVRRVPVTQRPPHGRVSLVMSTYGLDDDTFAAVQQRWTRWWGA